jgi:hypothetical protein
MNPLQRNKYVYAGLVGFLALLIGRVILAIAATFLSTEIPFPWLISFIGAGWLAYFVLKKMYY